MNLQYLFSTVFDSLFPPSGDALRVRNIFEKNSIQLYTPKYVDSIQTLSTYQNKNMQALIHEAKFQGNKNAWLVLNALLQRHLTEMHMLIEYIIPVPLSPARMRARGYNQVLKILQAKPLDPKYTILTNVLVRTRNTRPQTELARNERLTNMHDAFGVVHGESITGKHILLVDDVTTTGTTLKAAKAALLPLSPASITCLALAH